MIVKFKTKWNNSCDTIANFYNRQNNYFTKKNEKTKYILEKINKLLITTIPKTYKFISMCNYYQSPTIPLFRKNIIFDYKKRNILVTSFSIATSIYFRKGFLMTYIGLNAFLCRENLNTRYYKFKMLTRTNSNNSNKFEENSEENFVTKEPDNH